MEGLYHKFPRGKAYACATGLKWWYNVMRGWRRLGESNTVPRGELPLIRLLVNRPVSLPPSEIVNLPNNLGNVKRTLSCAKPVEEWRCLWKAKENRRNDR